MRASPYDELNALQPSPIVALNRAVALANLLGAQAGLDVIASIPGRERIESHHLLHAVLGELHWRLDNHRAAAESFRRALQLLEVGPGTGPPLPDAGTGDSAPV